MYITAFILFFVLQFQKYFSFQLEINLKKQIYQYPLNFIQYRRLFEIDKPFEILSLPIITIHLGTPKQKLNLIYNTGSQVSWVLRETETNIQQKPFYYNLSSTFLKSENIYELNSFTYGTLAYGVSDILYFNDEYYAEFNFFLPFFFSPNTLISDGEIGFAKKYKGINSDPFIIIDALNYSILNQLNIQKNISKNFSHKWINNKKGILYIGELPFQEKNIIDINYYINNSNYKNLNITKCSKNFVIGEISNFWNCQIEELRIGNEIINISLNNKTIFSTGERLIFIPEIVGDLMYNYGNYSEWSKKNCFFKFQVAYRELHCNIQGFKFEYFPNIYFNFNGYIIEIKPEDVFLINNNKYYRNIIIVSNKKDFWILGIPALKNHNIIFNDDGFVYFYKIKENDILKILLFSFGIICFLAIGLILFFNCKNKSEKKNNITIELGKIANDQ